MWGDICGIANTRGVIDVPLYLAAFIIYQAQQYFKDTYRTVVYMVIVSYTIIYCQNKYNL